MCEMNPCEMSPERLREAAEVFTEWAIRGVVPESYIRRVLGDPMGVVSVPMRPEDEEIDGKSKTS